MKKLACGIVLSVAVALGAASVYAADADVTGLVPTLRLTFDGQSLANTGTGTVTMNNEGTPTYVPSADGYALDAGVYVPYGTLSNVFAANRDSSIAVAATLGTRSTGILVSFRNASNFSNNGSSFNYSNS